MKLQGIPGESGRVGSSFNRKAAIRDNQNQRRSVPDNPNQVVKAVLQIYP